VGSRPGASCAGRWTRRDPWLDTAVLLLPAVGFLDAGDPRMTRTVERIREELGEGGLLRRSSAPDGRRHGLPDLLGLAAGCRAQAGDLEGAEEVLDELAACANDLGLLAERRSSARARRPATSRRRCSHVGLVAGLVDHPPEEDARATAA
jgi:GH15 family glucan-1,4-alpha-glucosidase